MTQKGSLVAPDRLRFDFSHPKAVTPEELAAIEAEVNAFLRQNDAVSDPADGARRRRSRAGAMALFGEKYGDEVRVVRMGREPDGAHHLGRAVRRHPLRAHRRHRAVQDHRARARSRPASAGSRR